MHYLQTSTVKEANVLFIVEISGHFSSKIAQEYQLPTASQKLNTTNECIASSLAGLHATVEQVCVYAARYVHMHTMLTVQYRKY